jgi:formylmethanofuran dehydrogenase subunit E
MSNTGSEVVDFLMAVINRSCQDCGCRVEENDFNTFDSKILCGVCYDNRKPNNNSKHVTP